MAGDSEEIHGVEMSFNVDGFLAALHKDINNYLLCPVNSPDKNTLKTLILEQADILKTHIVDEAEWWRLVGDPLRTANLAIVSGHMN